jgi:hypothetical protein
MTFSNLMTIISVTCLMSLARASITLLSKGDENGHSVLFQTLGKNF